MYLIHLFHHEGVMVLVGTEVDVEEYLLGIVDVVVVEGGGGYALAPFLFEVD